MKVSIQTLGKFTLLLLMAILVFNACSKDDDDTTMVMDDDDEPIENAVDFADANLELAVANALGKNSGPVSEDEILELVELNISGSSITDLKGLEFATNLEKLEMQSIEIGSMDPIADLSSLNHLDARNTTLPDGSLDFLDNLTNLRFVDFRGTGLSDISNLSILENLEEIYLRANDITDLSPLSGLTKLTYLNIHTNPVTDISPLANLTNLTQLIMRNVESGNEGLQTIQNLTSLWRLNARNTGITDLTILGEMMSMGALQDDPANLIFADVDIRENDFGEVTEDNDPYAPIRPYWSNITERAPEDLPEPVGGATVFEDATFEARVRQILGIGDNDPLTDDLLLTIEELDCRDLPIASIAGIEKIANATFMRFDGTNVTDLSPLESFTDITYFNINTTTGITDISPLANNTNLGTLIARNVPFGNEGMQTIANFTNLHRLNMRNTGVTDLSVLAELMAGGALQNENAPNNEAILDIRQIEADFCVIFEYIDNIADLSGGDFSDCE